MNKKVENLLSASQIQDYISLKNRALLDDCIIKNITNSTNDDAKKYLENSSNKIVAFFAEQQKAGRGRNNRKWVSPYGKNIYFSLGWRSNIEFKKMEGLSLAVGVSIMRALNSIGIENIELKWPNDLIIKENKLGGILVETSLGQDNSVNIIIGVGLNINMTAEEGKEIDQKWTSLNDLLKKEIDRNKIAGKILNESLNLITTFSRYGFKAFIKEYSSASFLQNKITTATLPSGKKITGIVKGVNDFGELILQKEDKIYTLRNGEVTISKIKESF